MTGRHLWGVLAVLLVSVCAAETCDADSNGTPGASCQAAVNTTNSTSNSTDTDTNSTNSTDRFVPKLDSRGVPIDDKIDQLFHDAIYTFTRKSSYWPKYMKVPSWHWAMLNDVQRNSAYRLAINKAVAKTKAKGLPARVLDIGTGSGLLSLLAHRAGADHVSTCEVNADLIEVAKENVKRNCNKTDCPIKILPKRSTDITVGPGQDMEHKANILVSEIVDSMLLRESIVPTVTHALESLVEPEAIIIPKGGKLYFMLFESKEMRDTHYLDNDVSGLDLSHLNEGCHDLTAQDFMPNFLYRSLADAVSGLIFDFAHDIKHIQSHQFFAFNITIHSDGVLDGMLMWLELNLDDELSVSCDPRLGKQHHPHWQHIIFTPKWPVLVKAGDVVTVLAGHGEVSVRAKMILINGQHYTDYPPYRIIDGSHAPMQGHDLRGRETKEGGKEAEGEKEGEGEKETSTTEKK